MVTPLTGQQVTIRLRYNMELDAHVDLLMGMG